MGRHSRSLQALSASVGKAPAAARKRQTHASSCPDTCSQRDEADLSCPTVYRALGFANGATPELFELDADV
eukprot:14416103-Alexandrium_andersonii.AAC.1